MKKNLKPYVYKHIEHVKVRYGTYCRMVRRVMVCGEVKYLRYGAEARASLNRAVKSYAIDPKPSDLSMSRLKWR